jgi:hypothetical protein
MEPWICHEAGHAITALHLGFRVHSIEIFQGKPRTMCDLNDAAKTNEERYLFLAGGIAGETCDLRDFDRTACAADQAKISEWGGKPIETYLPAASEIINVHKGPFRELKKKITSRMLERRIEGMVAGSGNTFEVLSRAEIEQIWNTFQ